MFEPILLLLISIVFFVAGTIKGTVGLGLPAVSLALLVVFMPLPDAIVLVLAPSIITNLWQARTGGKMFQIIGRIWPFLICAMPSIWLGTKALSTIDLRYLSGLLGCLLVVYATLGLTGFQPALSPRQEKWLGPLLGAINGILTGMTGTFTVPSVMYLQAIGFPRDMLIQAMGIVFGLSGIALTISLGASNFLTAQLGMSSVLAIIPALGGMVTGRYIRKKISEKAFRKLLFGGLGALGCYVIIRNLSI